MARCMVMGIVNVTEDSFSDGGRYLDQDVAVDHARELLTQGADIIDVGGESTRPGAQRIDAATEQRRVIPVLRELAQSGVRVSVDTMRAKVAAAAVEAGAEIINDVSGGLADPDMLSVMADSGQRVCLMHWKAEEYGDAAGQAHIQGDVVDEVHAQLRRLVERAVTAGIAPERIILDPGLGFAKTPEDNWALLHALPSFVGTGFPILVGASRKRFLQAVRTDRGMLDMALPGTAEHSADPATFATTALAAMQGAWAVRVHDVAGNRDAVDVAQAWREGGIAGGQAPHG